MTTASAAADGRITFAPTRPQKYGPRNFSWWHDQIIDWMLTHAGRPIYECADEMGRSRSWVYQVTNSDMFKARLEQRRTAHNTALSERISSKMTEVAIESLDEMKRRLADRGNTIPFEDLSKASNGLLERLGYGTKSPGNAVQVNVSQYGVPTAEEFRAAQDKARALERARSTEALPQVSPPGPAAQSPPPAEPASASAIIIDAEIVDD